MPELTEQANASACPNASRYGYVLVGILGIAMLAWAGMPGKGHLATPQQHLSGPSSKWGEVSRMHYARLQREHSCNANVHAPCNTFTVLGMSPACNMHGHGSWCNVHATHTGP